MALVKECLYGQGHWKMSSRKSHIRSRVELKTGVSQMVVFPPNPISSP